MLLNYSGHNYKKSSITEQSPENKNDTDIRDVHSIRYPK